MSLPRKTAPSRTITTIRARDNWLDLMRAAGDQHGITRSEAIQWLALLGVQNMGGKLPLKGDDLYQAIEEFRR